MKIFVSLALAAAVGVVAMPASAQFAKPEDAVKYRQSAPAVMGAHFSRIGAMANGRVPFDGQAAQEYPPGGSDVARPPRSGRRAGAGCFPGPAHPQGAPAPTHGGALV